ncbi:MAG TPA: hypothetical protein VIG84_07095, partial [Brevundimonas sp.]
MTVLRSLRASVQPTAAAPPCIGVGQFGVAVASGLPKLVFVEDDQTPPTDPQSAAILQVTACPVDAGALQAEHIRQLVLRDENPPLLAVSGVEAPNPFRQALKGRMSGVAGGFDPQSARARRGIGGEKLV